MSALSIVFKLVKKWHVSNGLLPPPSGAHIICERSLGCVGNILKRYKRYMTKCTFYETKIKIMANSDLYVVFPNNDVISLLKVLET